MAWNEPGGNKDRDPWGGGDQGPPDLDEAFRKFKEKFSGNKGGGSGGSGGKSGGEMPNISVGLVAGIAAVLLIVWAAFGIYQVDQQEEAIVLRFGQYNSTVPAGLHWNPPIIDSVQKVNTTKMRSARIQGLMLTEDENIVDVSLSVQYTVQDSKAFLLDVRDPEGSLMQAAESALRHVVGSSTLHDTLTEGRVAIAGEVQDRLQSYIDLYRTGILVAAVNIEDAQPPAEVQEAFDDVIRAREDEIRVVNQAMSYRNAIVPEARGIAQRQIEEANAYLGRVVSSAEGEASRFEQLLVEYERSPDVTRERLYINTMQTVLSNASKVMIDIDSGNLLYLPLDKLMGGNASGDRALQGFDQPINVRPVPQDNTGRTSRRTGVR